MHEQIIHHSYMYILIKI